MSNNPGQTGGDDEWVKNSSLYREFLAEREEIMKHKWIESEKAQHDVGFERALTRRRRSTHRLTVETWAGSKAKSNRTSFRTASSHSPDCSTRVELLASCRE